MSELNYTNQTGETTAVVVFFAVFMIIEGFQVEIQYFGGNDHNELKMENELSSEPGRNGIPIKIMRYSGLPEG